MYEIETERTFLRVPTLNDLDALADILGNAQVMKYMDVDCQPISREQTEIALVSIINGWKKNGFGRWSVVSKADNKIIGLAGFRKHEEIGELFYVLDEPFWGKGLATEIASRIIETGFEKHDFSRIIGITRPANSASRRVMEKLGMSFVHETVLYGIFVVEYTISNADYLEKRRVENETTGAPL